MGEQVTRDDGKNKRTDFVSCVIPRKVLQQVQALWFRQDDGTGWWRKSHSLSVSISLSEAYKAANCAFASSFVGWQPATELSASFKTTQPPQPATLCSMCQGILSPFNKRSNTFGTYSSRYLYVAQNGSNVFQRSQTFVMACKASLSTSCGFASDATPHRVRRTGYRCMTVPTRFVSWDWYANRFRTSPSSNLAGPVGCPKRFQTRCSNGYSIHFLSATDCSDTSIGRLSNL